MAGLNKFNAFSEIYDSTTDESAVLFDLLNKVVKKTAGKKILEAGCGTGKYTLLLCQAGFDVTALDPSKEMLIKAREKVLKNGLNCSFLHKKIQDVSFRNKFDFVFVADTINSILTEKELKKAFRTCFSALKKGGKLFVDTSTINYYKSILSMVEYGGRVEENFFTWEDSLVNDEYFATITIFSPAKNGFYKKTVEQYIQKVHSLEQVKALLKKTGFSKIKAFARNMKKAGEKEKIVYFVAEKK